MKKQEFIFGVFTIGCRLVFPIGKPVFCTIEQAEFVARLLSKQISSVLQPGDYFAYDFAINHKTNA